MVVMENSDTDTWSREPVLIEKSSPLPALCTSCCALQEQQRFLRQFRVMNRTVISWLGEGKGKIF